MQVGHSVHCANLGGAHGPYHVLAKKFRPLGALSRSLVPPQPNAGRDGRQFLGGRLSEVCGRSAECEGDRCAAGEHSA